MGTERTTRLSPGEHMALAEFLAGGLPAGQLDTTLARAREQAASQRAQADPPPPGPHLQPFSLPRLHAVDRPEAILAREASDRGGGLSPAA